MNTRQIEAYRRRLAKITTAQQLTYECINAVIAWESMGMGDQPEPEVLSGTLTSFRVYTGEGLLGPIFMVDVTICDACVGQYGGNRCEDSDPFKLYGATAIMLARNEDGVAEAVERWRDAS